jgi:hypothetical protein
MFIIDNIRKYSTNPIIKIRRGKKEIVLICLLPKKEGEIFNKKLIKLLNK